MIGHQLLPGFSLIGQFASVFQDLANPLFVFNISQLRLSISRSVDTPSLFQLGTVQGGLWRYFPAKVEYPVKCGFLGPAKYDLSVASKYNDLNVASKYNQLSGSRLEFIHILEVNVPHVLHLKLVWLKLFQAHFECLIQGASSWWYNHHVQFTSESSHVWYVMGNYIWKPQASLSWNKEQKDSRTNTF